ncbi:hypothetical protein JCM14469_34630 [Desulfatiferula olefinivorans]
MILKPQDIVIALKILACEQTGAGQWSYSQLAAQLFMSPSEVHSGVKRAIQSRLLDINRKPVRRALGELLIHGVKYVFPADYGGIVRGMPTSYAAPPINKHILSTDTAVPVWPHPDGNTQGMALFPIYKSVPDSSMIDSVLYEYLVITDALRGGKARERQIAEDELQKRLNNDQL